VGAVLVARSVTADAMPIVRRAIVRYVGSSHRVRKLSSDQVRTISLVNGSTDQNADTNSAASAAT
jgi:hypothetical protein